jgi:hypothetical protein
MASGILLHEYSFCLYTNYNYSVFIACMLRFHSVFSILMPCLLKTQNKADLNHRSKAADIIIYDDFTIVSETRDILTRGKKDKFTKVNTTKRHLK